MLSGEPQEYTDNSGGQFSIVDPLSMWNATEAIARGGQRLQVVWSVFSDDGSPSATGSVVREGRMGELKFKPTRLQDIEWEIEFLWQSRGTTTSQPVTSTRSNTVVADSAAYQNALQDLIDANEDAQTNDLLPTFFSLGISEGVASAPILLSDNLNESVSLASFDVLTVTSIAATISSQPDAITNRAVDLAQDSVVQANIFYDTLSEVPYELLTQDPSRLSSLMFAFNQFATQSDAAQNLAQVAQQFTAQLRQQVQALLNSGRIAPTRLGDPNNILRSYMTKQGDTPASVSARMYGTPDHAIDILRANNLSWYTPTFQAGRVLIIPRLSNTNPSQSV